LNSENEIYVKPHHECVYIVIFYYSANMYYILY
jgi:hypothetical protein